MSVSYIADCVEDYAIFQIAAFSTPCSAAELYATYAQEVAQILRLVHVALRAGSPRRHLTRIAFGLDDVSIVLPFVAGLLRY